jgi:hypothetical protein
VLHATRVAIAPVMSAMLRALRIILMSPVLEWAAGKCPPWGRVPKA